MPDCRREIALLVVFRGGPMGSGGQFVLLGGFAV